MKKHTFSELAELLEGQKRIYQEFLKLSRQKQDMLVSGTINELDEVVKKEELLIHQLGKLEENRYHVAESLAAAYNMPEQVSLKEMLKEVPEEEGVVLEKVYQELQNILGEVKKNNNENAGLIEQSLKYMKFTVDVLTGGTSVTYTSEKKEKIDAGRRILDKKA